MPNQRPTNISSNATGKHDFNSDLCRPITKTLSASWEKCFKTLIPRVLAKVVVDGTEHLTKFHAAINDRFGDGAALLSIQMLEAQLENHASSLKKASTQLTNMVNSRQKEINRQFVQVVKSRLAKTYQDCTMEHGQVGRVKWIRVNANK